MRYILNSLPESEVLGGFVVVWPDAAIMADTNINQFSIFFSFFENAHIFFTSRFQIAIFLGRQTLTSAMVELEKFGTYCLKFLQWLRVKSNIFWNGK